MYETAAHLVNRVIPQIPVRLWVLSLLCWARFLLGRDPMLITRSLEIALRTIFAHQRRRARRTGALAPRHGWEVVRDSVSRFGPYNVQFAAQRIARLKAQPVGKGA